MPTLRNPMKHADPDTSLKWYLVKTKVRQELQARDQLSLQGYKNFLPMISVEKVKNGKRSLSTEPLFSGYLFIQLNQVDHDWGPIRSTKGVSHLVHFGSVPASLSDAQIEAIAYWTQALPKRELFEANQAVEVVDGPFVGMEAFFQKIQQMESGEERALVLMNLFGRKQRILMDVGALKASSSSKSLAI